MKIYTHLNNLIAPQSTEPNRRIRELLLNILISVSILGFTVLNILRVKDIVTGSYGKGLPIIYTLLILVFFVFLFWLSKKGQTKVSAWLLVITYSLPMFYCFIVWGADLPAALLLAVMTITLAGILLGQVMVLASTGFITSFIILITYLQTNGIISQERNWRNEAHGLEDVIAYAILLMLVAVVAWLFCRGIARSLKRAMDSEKELQKERDSLEIKVQERTRELRQMEEEKINQLYRLAKFGRLSSGIFHDLVNPLTAISLNLEQVSASAENQVSQAKSYLTQALSATRRMEGLVAGIKRQIQAEGRQALFSVNEEISQITEILSYKARQAKIKIFFDAEKEVILYGDAIKFGQIIMNILANAIEASEDRDTGAADRPPKEKEVRIDLTADPAELKMVVTDQGTGIPAENLMRIFAPFFSTKKDSGRGLGIGLASAKNIVEKDFNGRITAENLSGELGPGARFIVNLPIKNAP